jgi:hypothetical protein
LVWQPNSGADNAPAGQQPQNGQQNQQQPAVGGSSSSSSNSTASSSSNSPTAPISSIVKFPFERKSPRELLVELELFDKVFLHKRDVIRLKVGYLLFLLSKLLTKSIFSLQGRLGLEQVSCFASLFLYL